MLQIIWSHGWGFNAPFFTPMRSTLSGYNHFVIDWGYFSNPQPVMPRSDQPLIGIGHSLGFAKLLELGLSFDGLISLGGFTRFCQADDFKAGMPHRILQRMQTGFQLNPHRVLADFYTSCGYDALPHSVELMNIGLLQEDLQKLMRVTQTLPSVPFLAIAGVTDRICSLNQQQTLFPAVKTVQGGHNFPYVDFLPAAKLIQNFLRDFR